MLSESFERLNALAKICSASKYLEIGVAKGLTFRRVDVPYKVAVDPNFRLDINKYADPKTIFHEVMSDAFFSTHASEHRPFDLIYLDGLHTFEQTFRDFCASIGNSHANTIWLIDDTCPSGWLAANRNRGLTDRLRGRFRIESRDWMGDVFKVVFAIHDFFPQFTYATFPGHGQTVVWLETRKNFSPTWNSFEKISRLGYRQFLSFRDSHMLIREVPHILESVRISITSRRDRQAIVRKRRKSGK